MAVGGGGVVVVRCGRDWRAGGKEEKKADLGRRLREDGHGRGHRVR